ncbi:MAG: hypothetical protein J3Q66DRAFT_321310 [Benniella sp.]|nr:MAG: hypothetical protein J3Q66DRAFT_321310 [Benniella sp.]
MNLTMTDEAMGMASSKGSEAEAVAEEPDAGEHFMQATSQFFSKMGYWLYISKVVNNTNPYDTCYSNAPQDTSSALSNNGGNNSVSTLKNLMGSTKGSNTTAGSGGKSRPSSITVEVAPDETSTSTASAIAVPASSVGKTTTFLGSAPGGHPLEAENTTHQPDVFSSSPPQVLELTTQESAAPGVTFTDETNHKRERKRKTSCTLVGSLHDGLILHSSRVGYQIILGP